MITLRLFKSSDPFQEIESRVAGQGDLVIGRDSSADWHIPDQQRDLSRRHCILTIDGKRIFLRDVSTGGVTIGVERQRAPYGERCELAPGDTVFLGEFMILLDVEGASELEGDPVIDAAAIPAPAPGAVSAAPLTDAALLEAFCIGAGLEASSFAGEDPAAVMTRLGAVYRQVIDDLGGMIRDRALVKNQLQMDRTTIASRDNNPLKWAPSYRVSVDLLKEGGGGFLKGAAAFKASFNDLRRHGACIMAGSDAALHYVLSEFDPDSLEACARRQASPFASKYEAMWKVLKERHATLSGGESDGRIDQAFRQGYERRLSSLEDEEQAA
jgi:predicted component of type VI protein secretion system